MRDILWSKTPPPNGAAVQSEVDAFLAQKHAAAPKRGKGARRRRFIGHVVAAAQRYGDALYHCYDDPRIPPTTNDLEGQHGVCKRHLRKVHGRGSTCGGPTETIGEFLVGAIDAVKRRGVRDTFAGLDAVDPTAYAQARAELRRLREPARRYRSIQRDPARHLEEILRRWDLA